MVPNTFFNNLAGYPLSIHKIQVDPPGRAREVVYFGIRIRKIDRLILNLTPPEASKLYLTHTYYS